MYPMKKTRLRHVLKEEDEETEKVEQNNRGDQEKNTNEKDDREGEMVIFRPIAEGTLFSDISDTSGTREVPDDPRMLASATAYAQGSSWKS